MVQNQRTVVATTQEEIRPIVSWLIIGGDGQLGLSFRELLTERNIPFDFSTIDTLDITHADAVNEFVSKCAPSVVVNCAAWTAVDAAEDNVDAAHAVNCDGARFVAQAAKNASSAYVLVSTDYVFPGNATTPYKEDDPTGPMSVYGKTKLCGELAALEEYPSNTYIVRTAWLYSKYGHNFVKTMTRHALAGKAVRVVNDQLGQPTHAGNLAQHIAELVELKAPTGIYHGTNSGETSWYGLTREIYSLLGQDGELVSPVPSSEYPTKATRPSYSVLSHQETLRNKITEMQPWEDALRQNMSDIRRVTEAENT
jgi:dTDP-4-dehydrorhamnose reductase